MWYRVWEGSSLLDLHGFKEAPLRKEHEYLLFVSAILLLSQAKEWRQSCNVSDCEHNKEKT